MDFGLLAGAYNPKREEGPEMSPLPGSPAVFRATFAPCARDMGFRKRDSSRGVEPELSQVERQSLSHLQPGTLSQNRPKRPFGLKNPKLRTEFGTGKELDLRGNVSESSGTIVSVVPVASFNLSQNRSSPTHLLIFKNDHIKRGQGGIRRQNLGLSEPFIATIGG